MSTPPRIILRVLVDDRGELHARAVGQAPTLDPFAFPHARDLRRNGFIVWIEDLEAPATALPCIAWGSRSRGEWKRRTT